MFRGRLIKNLGSCNGIQEPSLMVLWLLSAEGPLYEPQFYIVTPDTTRITVKQNIR